MPLLWWFLFSAILLPAQDLQRIDSLKRINRNKPDQFDILNRIAWEYHNSYQDSTIKYAGQAYELGKKLGLKKNLAKPLNYTGVAYEYKGEAIDAYDFYKQALLVATTQNDEPQIAYANNNTGRLFFEQGNIARSEECYSKALTLFEKLRDSSGIAYVYLSLAHPALGRCYHRLNQDEKKQDQEAPSGIFSFHNRRDPKRVTLGRIKIITVGSRCKRALTGLYSISS